VKNLVDESSIDIEPEDVEELAHVKELLEFFEPETIEERKEEIGEMIGEPEEKVEEFIKEKTDLEKFLDGAGGGYFYVVYSQKK
jgi:hypothetical protein